jgi:hypothetical protein
MAGSSISGTGDTNPSRLERFGAAFHTGQLGHPDRTIVKSRCRTTALRSNRCHETRMASRAGVEHWRDSHESGPFGHF